MTAFLPIGAYQDWTEADLVKLREWRKKHARTAQDPDLGKECRRDAQKCEKAATLVLNFIEGKGRYQSCVPADVFPEELHGFVLRAFGSMDPPLTQAEVERVQARIASRQTALATCCLRDVAGGMH